MSRLSLSHACQTSGRPRALLFNGSSAAVVGNARLGPGRMSSHLLLAPPSMQHRPFHSSPATSGPSHSSCTHPTIASYPTLRQTCAHGRFLVTGAGSSSSSSSRPLLLRRAMGLSSENLDNKPGRAKPGTPGWTVKRRPPPDNFEIKTQLRSGNMKFQVRRETARDREVGLKAMFRDYSDADWEIKPLLLYLSLVFSVWGFFAMSELTLSAAKTSRVAAVGQARQAEHDSWKRSMFVSWDGLMEGRLWTLVTNAVTTDRFMMLPVNITMTLLVGPQLIVSLGSPLAFFGLCATSSAVGSLSSAYAMHQLGEDEKLVGGGSATVNGLVTYFMLSKGFGTFRVGGMVLGIATWLLPLANAGYVNWVDYDSRKHETDPATKPGGELVAPVAGALGGTLFFIARKILKL